MIILRNAETFEKVPYSFFVGPHTYKGRGSKVAEVTLEDSREFPLKHGETIRVNNEEWEVYEF